MVISPVDLPPQSQSNFMLQIDDLFGGLTDAANAQVTWLSNIAEMNLDWRKLEYNRSSYFLKALDRSGRVREMMTRYHSAQQRMTQVT
jgi:hypothetical protein